jgi:hypothetical protein
VRVTRVAVAILLALVLLACGERVILRTEGNAAPRTATLISRTSDSGLCVDAVIRIVDRDRDESYESEVGRCHDEASDVPYFYNGLEWEGEELILRSTEVESYLPAQFEVGPVHVRVNRIPGARNE